MSKVLKFGGKSLASLHTNNNLLNIIANYLETSSLIIVVSAIGNTTDLLLELLQKGKENKPNMRIQKQNERRFIFHQIRCENRG